MYDKVPRQGQPTTGSCPLANTLATNCALQPCLQPTLPTLAFPDLTLTTFPTYYHYHHHFADRSPKRRVFAKPSPHHDRCALHKSLFLISHCTLNIYSTCLRLIRQEAQVAATVLHQFLMDNKRKSAAANGATEADERAAKRQRLSEVSLLFPIQPALCTSALLAPAFMPLILPCSCSLPCLTFIITPGL